MDQLQRDESRLHLDRVTAQPPTAEMVTKLFDATRLCPACDQELDASNRCVVHGYQSGVRSWWPNGYEARSRSQP